LNGGEPGEFFPAEALRFKPKICIRNQKIGERGVKMVRTVTRLKGGSGNP
jgi:hypothetical protein